MPQIIPIKKNNSEISAMYKDIEISEKQIEASQIKDARTALGETRAKYGL